MDRVVRKDSRLYGGVLIFLALLAILETRLYLFLPFQLLSIFLGLALFITFVHFPLKKSRYIDAILVLIGLIAIGRVFFFGVSIPPLVYHSPSWFDWTVGASAIVVITEASRRNAGPVFAIVIFALLLYALFGAALPGLFRHPGASWGDLVKATYLNTYGIWGTPLSTAIRVIFPIIVWGALLNRLGGGRSFVDLALALFGRFTGGAAKTAIVGSFLFGMISGSPTSNAATTGSITIPLMKRIGYEPKFAAAVEAVSSYGGQLMPPVMGISAFIMADLLRIPYSDLMIRAVMPGIIFYALIFALVHVEAVRKNLGGLPKNELPSATKALLDCIHILPSPVVLVYFLVIQKLSITSAIFYAIVALVALTLARNLVEKKNVDIRSLIVGMKEGSHTACFIVVITAAIGIVVGLLDWTGLAIRFSDILIQLAGNSLFLLLILSMIASLVLGMELPTVVAYMITSLLVAPAIVSFGVDPIAAHLFVFYFCIISSITPPVGITVLVTSRIAGSSYLGTCLKATQLGTPTYVLPFVWVYFPALLLIDNPLNGILAVITILAGLLPLVQALSGFSMWNRRRLGRVERAIFLASAMFLFYPAWQAGVIGIALFVTAFLPGLKARRLREKNYVKIPK